MKCLWRHHNRCADTGIWLGGREGGERGEERGTEGGRWGKGGVGGRKWRGVGKGDGD